VLGAGFEVFTRSGKLMLRALSQLPVMYRGAELHPGDDTDPCVFRIDLSQQAMPSVRVFFSRQPHTGAASVTTEFMPPTAYKQPAVTNPRRWVTGALTVATTAIAARRVSATLRHRDGQAAGHARRS
jgi:hypothetical protein